MDGYRNVYQRMDDVLDALTWALSRNPRLGEQLPRFPEYRVFETTSMGDTPAFWVLYTFDPERVELLSIEPVKSDSEDDQSSMG